VRLLGASLPQGTFPEVKTVKGRGSKGLSLCILWPFGLNAGPVPSLGQQIAETFVTAAPADINVSIDDSPLRLYAEGHLSAVLSKFRPCRATHDKPDIT
jgi:hypothetical protein